MPTARLIIDEPAVGSWNMAVDQALLNTANDAGLPTFRLYRWSPPTLSLGYFQAAASRDQHGPSQRCDLVRRASGGGAILHDDELTYSLCLPSENRWASQHDRLYETVHHVLIDLFLDWGYSAALHGDLFQESPAAGSVRGAEPFLCFQRRSDGDIVVDQQKIVGSAQRRSKNALLQHGSILLGRSNYAPELPGLTDLTPQTDALGAESIRNTIVQLFVEKLGNALGFSWQVGSLTTGEIGSAKTLQSDQFEHADWTGKR